jgi:hypothetical protein
MQISQLAALIFHLVTIKDTIDCNNQSIAIANIIQTIFGWKIDKLQIEQYLTKLPSNDAPPVSGIDVVAGRDEHQRIEVERGKRRATAVEEEEEQPEEETTANRAARVATDQQGAIENPKHCTASKKLNKTNINNSSYNQSISNPKSVAPQRKRYKPNISPSHINNKNNSLTTNSLDQPGDKNKLTTSSGNNRGRGNNAHNNKRS